MRYLKMSLEKDWIAGKKGLEIRKTYKLAKNGQ